MPDYYSKFLNRPDEKIPVMGKQTDNIEKFWCKKGHENFLYATATQPYIYGLCKECNAILKLTRYEEAYAELMWM